MEAQEYFNENSILEENEEESLLVKTCRDVIKDAAGVDEMQRVYDKTVSQLKETRIDFDITLSGQSRKIQKTCSQLASAINHTFDEYKRILDEMGSYFHSFDKEILAETLEKALDVSDRLDQYFLEFREMGLIALGPTQIPGLNLLLNTVNKIRNGEALDDTLAEHAEREETAIEKILEELEKDPNEELESQAEAYLTLLDSIELLANYLESGNSDILEDAYAGLQEAARMFNSLSGVIDEEKMAQSPTSSPMANVIINSVPGLKDGSIPPEFFGDAVQRLWDELEMLRFRYNAIQRSPAESSMVEEESEILGDILIAFDDILTEYFDALDNWNLGSIDETTERLKLVIEELHTSMKTFQQISETEGKTPCVKCGFYNLPGLRFCKKCNFKLPVIAGEQKGGLDVREGSPAKLSRKEVPRMTENINRLFEAAKNASVGQISMEEFEEVIAWMESLLSQAYQAVGPIPPANLEKVKGKDREKIRKFDELIREAADVYAQGLEDFEVGLSFFRQFVNDGSTESVQTGMQMIWQALGKLQDVQRATGGLAKKQQ